MKIIVKKFNQLDLEELYGILKLRNKVFIVEQECPYQDVDGEDQEAHHLFIKKDNEIIACTRVLVIDGKLSIGRVIVDERYRGQGIANKIVDYSIDYAFDNYEDNSIYIEAQVYLTKFYESLGFIRISEDFILDNIVHCEMKINRN